MKSFKSELEMTENLMQSEHFMSYCLTLSMNTYITKEFKGYFGIPDLMIFDVKNDTSIASLGKAVAIELKLSDWRRALEQAYRYKAFADLSLVIIDAAKIKPALCQLGYFKKSRIGLVSYSVEDVFEEIYIPPFETPYVNNLRTKLEKVDFLRFQQLSTFCVN